MRISNWSVTARTILRLLIPETFAITLHHQPVKIVKIVRSIKNFTLFNTTKIKLGLIIFNVIKRLFNVKRKAFKRMETLELVMKVRVIISRPYGNIEVEGESLDEVVEGLETFPEWLAVIDKLVAIPETPSGEDENLLEGIIEPTTEGPQLIVSKEMVNSKEAISLLLYAQDPTPIEPKQIGRLLNLSGHGSAGYGSRLSEMRREGTVVREEGGYRISTSGKKVVEDLIQRLNQQMGMIR